MKQKLKSDLFNERCIKIYVLIAFVLMFLTIPTYAGSDPLEVNIISSSQVKPGTVMKIRVSIINTEEFSSLPDQSQNIAEKTKNIYNIMKDEKNKVTIYDINYENPFQLSEKKATFKSVSVPKSTQVKEEKYSPQSIESNTVTQYSISRPKQEKKLVNRQIAPIGNALKLKDELKTEFSNRIKTETLSNDQIKSFVDLEAELKDIIDSGENSIVLEIPIPSEFPEGTTLTIPINIAYSTDSLSTQIFSTFATVTVTSNPVPKRAIIIDIDGVKRDALSSSPFLDNLSFPIF